MSTPNGSSSSSFTCQTKSDSESSSSNNLTVDDSSPDSHVKDKSVRASLENFKYSLDNAPLILEITNSEVYINKDGPNQNEFNELEDEVWNPVLTEKLEAHSSGDYNLTVYTTSAMHFESRDEVDDLFLQEWNPFNFIPVIKKNIVFDRISFKKALKDVFHLKISCNMAYYKKHLDEMEKDSGYNFESMDLSLEGLKRLKNILLFKLSLEIFGDINDEEEKEKSTVIFRDFHLLYDDGNEILATARRGNLYLIFYYFVS